MVSLEVEDAAFAGIIQECVDRHILVFFYATFPPSRPKNHFGIFQRDPDPFISTIYTPSKLFSCS